MATQTDNDLRIDLDRFKALYQQEREQLEEFQRYSKELETEMDMELTIYKKKVSELETQNRKLAMENAELKKRSEKERNDFIENENFLKTRLTSAEETCRELREKLRKVEQENDDYERRDRIQTQELIDWAARYEKCLERCAYLEAGMFSADENKMDTSTGVLVQEGVEMSSNSKFTSASFSPDTTSSAAKISSEWMRSTSTAGAYDDELTSPPTSRMRLANGIASDDIYKLGRECRKSSEIVSSLFRKIEEVERQVSPKKYVIHRTPAQRH